MSSARPRIVADRNFGNGINWNKPVTRAAVPPCIIAGLIRSPKPQGYDWVHPEITDKNFPPATGKFSIEEARLEVIIGSKDVALDQLSHLRRRAANAAETLHYGIKNPCDQRRHLIWCLGQIWVDPRNGCVCTVVLCAKNNKRNASIYDVRDIRDGDRFLSLPL